MKCIPIGQLLPRFARRSVVLGTLLAAFGCMQWSAAPNGTVPHPDVAVIRLYLRDGSSVTLKGAMFSPDSIEGVAPDSTRFGIRVAVARADVDRIDVPHVDFVRTGELLIALAAAGVAAAITLPFAVVRLFPPS